MGLLFWWFLNFLISGLNAWGCGKSWNETKNAGGFSHFMNWMGAIMAACGFTWCYMVILGFVCSSIPIEQEDGTHEMLLSGEALQAFCELGYIVIIGPILGSGLAITVHSWVIAWRRRSFGDMAVAGWNTYAQASNTLSAVSNVPSFSSHLSSFFKGDGDKRGVIVIALVAIAAFGGILTTWWIISATAASTARSAYR